MLMASNYAISVYKAQALKRQKPAPHCPRFRAGSGSKNINGDEFYVDIQRPLVLLGDRPSVTL